MRNANIQLRKDNQQLRDRIAQLETQSQADRQRIAGLEKQATTVPVLAQQQLDKLFTAYGLKFGRLTGGVASDSKSTWDDLIKVYVVPVDADSQPLKAAGQFTVAVFDLTSSGGPLVASRTFDLDQTRAAWFGQAMLYTYVLDVPLPHAPQHGDLTVVATFRDELTGRTISAQQQIVIRLPAAASAVQ